MPGVIQGIELDTDFFTGNFTPRISVQGAAIEEPRKLMALRTSIMGTAASKEALAEAEALNSAVNIKAHHHHHHHHHKLSILASHGV